MEVLVVPVGGRQPAFPLAAIRETLPLAAVAPLPGAPPAVLGAVNVHGDVLVLLDTGLLLGTGALEAPTHAAVVTAAHGTAALAATDQPVTAVLEDTSTLVAIDALLHPDRVASAGC